MSDRCTPTRSHVGSTGWSTWPAYVGSDCTTSGRSYATLSLDNGVTPKILSDRIGHSDMSVTFQVYGHHSTGQDREAAELVATLIREALKLPATEP